MSLKCGIVGLPNVGKSTLFNCLSSAKAQAANFPFCTIEPNVGVITVPDERLTRLAEIVHPGRIVPATCEIVDIASLVKGASKGEGLGNKFLGNIRETDAIIHVLRCFEDDNITHVDGSIDPIRRWPQRVGTGYYFGLCLTGIFTARFFIEYTKEVQEAFEASLPLDMGQLLSLPFIAIGAWCMMKAGRH